MVWGFGVGARLRGGPAPFEAPPPGVHPARCPPRQVSTPPRAAPPLPRQVWIRQRGCSQGVLWRLEAQALLEVEEAKLPLGRREARFTMLEGDFQVGAAVRHAAAVCPTCPADRSPLPRLQPCATACPWLIGVHGTLLLYACEPGCTLPAGDDWALGGGARPVERRRHGHAAAL